MEALELGQTKSQSQSFQLLKIRTGEPDGNGYNNTMNTEVEIWVAPAFEDVSVSMECTAYSETLD